MEREARVRVRAPCRDCAAAPPPAWCVAARARACVPAVRAGRDAEVKFGRERERSVSLREPEWPPLLSPARRQARGRGEGRGRLWWLGGRVGYPAARPVGLKVSGRVCWGARGRWLKGRGAR